MCQFQIAVDARIGRVNKNNHAEFWALVAYFCSLDLVVAREQPCLPRRLIGIKVAR